MDSYFQVLFLTRLRVDYETKSKIVSPTTVSCNYIGSLGCEGPMGGWPNGWHIDQPGDSGLNSIYNTRYESSCLTDNLDNGGCRTYTVWWNSKSACKLDKAPLISEENISCEVLVIRVTNMYKMEKRRFGALSWMRGIIEENTFTVRILVIMTSPPSLPYLIFCTTRFTKFTATDLYLSLVQLHASQGLVF